MGRPVNVGSVHAVATRADRRRRGLCRRLMEEMLAYAEGRYETLVLTTENPQYYTPFGFRVLQEHRFTVRLRPRPRRDGLRVLDLAQESDVALLNRMLDERSPVSEVVGVGREKAVFFVNEGRRPLHYAPTSTPSSASNGRGVRSNSSTSWRPRCPAWRRSWIGWSPRWSA